MNRRVLLRNAFSAAAQTLVQTAALFFVYRYLIAAVGIERLGVWGIVLATTSVARASELGLAGSVTKFIAAHRARGDHAAARGALETAGISLAVLFAIVLPVLYFVLAAVLPSVLPSRVVAEAQALLPYALVSMWLSAVSGIWLGGLDGCLRTDLRAGLVIASTLIFTAIAFATVSAYGLVGLAVAQVAQGAILAVAGWAALRHAMRPLPLLPRTWDRSRFREMLGYGVNIQVMTIVMLLFEPTTKLLFARFGGLAAAGYFELAQQLVMKARAVIVETNRVVVPVISGLAAAGANAPQFYARNVRVLFFVLTPLFACLVSLVPAISELWIGAYAQPFVVIATALTVAWYINSLTAPTYFAYLGHGELRWLTVSHLALGIGNAVLGVLLGPLFGWVGVTIAFVVSLVIGSLVPVWTYHREHRLRVSKIVRRSDVALTAFCAAAAGTALAVYSKLLPPATALPTRLAVVTAFAAAILAAAARHPLAPEVWLLIRRARGEGADGTR